MVEPGCEYRPLAPGILQGFAVGMFQKASVPGPVRVKEAHSVPCTRPPASLQSLGLHFLHQGNLRGSLPGGRGRLATAVFTVLQCPPPSGASCAALGCQDPAHMQAQALVCFLNLDVLIMEEGGDFFIFK